jgi:hypothetical protein
MLMTACCGTSSCAEQERLSVPRIEVQLTLMQPEVYDAHRSKGWASWAGEPAGSGAGVCTVRIENRQVCTQEVMKHKCWCQQGQVP